ncbi:MAG: outer membrane protein transport protein [Elusimicrobia bacterium]|jgi:long-chain fatty acid transport protein|nr:outer membrane protein transport protein [Elusimicrobiota bacterium]
MGKHMIKLGLCASIVGLFTQIGWSVGSRGLGNQAIGAYALGQGNAVVARAEDPSANFFNPAALPFIEGTMLGLGTEVITPYYSHIDTAGNEEKASNHVFVIPNLFVGGPLGQTKWAWGVGLTSPYGLGTTWGTNGFSKYMATDSKLHVLHTNPNVAYKINEGFSVAAGIDYMRADADLKRQVSVGAVNSETSPFTSPDGNFQQKGDGAGWGWNVAAFVKPKEGQRLGLTYRSKISMTIDGTAKLDNMSGAMAFVFGGTSYSTGGESVLRFPDATTLGYSFDITKKWNVEADIEWTGWSTFNEQRIRYTQETDPTRLAILNTGNPQPRQWKDVFSAALGTQYQLNERWKLRGGFMYMDSPVPNKTYEPSIPDSDLYGIALGTGYKVGAIGVDVAYLANIFPNRTVNNTVGAPLSNASGTYKSFANSFSLNFSYKF